MHPGCTEFDRHAPRRIRTNTPTHAITRFEHRDVGSRGTERTCRRETGDACADHDDGVAPDIPVVGQQHARCMPTREVGTLHRGWVCRTGVFTGEDQAAANHGVGKGLAYGRRRPDG